MDFPWNQYLDPQTRELVLGGRTPTIRFDSRPDLAQGDRIILASGRIGDPELRTTVSYPSKWITVVKVSRAEGEGYLLDYSPPPRRPMYLRPATGYTSERYLSIDQEAEAEMIEVSPEQRGMNTLLSERKRIEEALAGHLKRFRTATSDSTRRILAPVIRDCKRKLVELEEILEDTSGA